MSKAPAFQFYPADWRKDPALQMCGMVTQGIWINLLCVMWEQPERGKISGDLGQFCRLLGCSKDEFEIFLRENETQNFATVTFCNEIVTVINRRMYKEDRERKANHKRVLRHRAKNEMPLKRESNALVTSLSSSSSSSSYNNTQANMLSESEGVACKFSIDEVKAHAVLVGITTEQAENFYNYYNSQGWLKANKLPVVDLVSQMVTWKNNQFRFEAKNGTRKSKDSIKTGVESFADQQSNYGTEIHN